jgi:ABC-2 type transport system permease protein
MSHGFSRTLAVFKRELSGYFVTPVAYVFLIVFLALAGALTFYIGNFFDRNQADLESFFTFHPWLYLFLVPAISMRLWAEERKSGTVELLLTLPVSLWDAVLGKFLAAWVITWEWPSPSHFPSRDGQRFREPDNGAVLASYASAAS